MYLHHFLYPWNSASQVKQLSNFPIGTAIPVRFFWFSHLGRNRRTGVPLEERWLRAEATDVRKRNLAQPMAKFFQFFVGSHVYYPKNPWTLQWRGLNLYSRGPGPQNSHFWGVRILRVGKISRLNFCLRVHMAEWGNGGMVELWWWSWWRLCDWRFLWIF